MYKQKPTMNDKGDEKLTDNVADMKLLSRSPGLIINVAFVSPALRVTHLVNSTKTRSAKCH